MIGLAFGGEVEVIAFLVSRYFGLRSFGLAYGVGFSSFVLAGAAGTYLWARASTVPTLTPPRSSSFFFLMLVAAFLFTP